MHSGFAFGQGTDNQPYLISTGAELAYLASQVNDGENYDGEYFQLTNNIDLNNIEWTPIGTHSNSFRGVFDGAGHGISNISIIIDTLPTNVVNSYGIFGSLGGGNYDSIIKNLELDTTNISITATGNTNTSTTTKGLHIGTIVGTMYKNAKVINCITKSGSITDTGTISIRNRYFQLATGGIAGFASNTSDSESDPGSGNRYLIENCYSNVNVDIDVTLYRASYGGQFHTGGIIGTIRCQPVWPTNCLYEGTINANGFIGPIFGGLRNNSSFSGTGYFATIWNGNDAGNLTLNNVYYTGYRANNTTFTNTISSGTSTSRISNSSSNIGYVQGVNKGIYTSDASSMQTNFNNYAGSSYCQWEYADGTYYLKPHLSARMNDTQAPIYQATVVYDAYSSGPYTYSWYINNNIVNGNTSNTLTQNASWDESFDIKAIIYKDGYYAIARYFIPRISIDIVFDINTNTNSVTARLTGTGLQYANLNDYTYNWYREDVSGIDTENLETNTLTIANLEEGVEYRLTAINGADARLSAENSFIYGDRTVVYINYAGGSNYSDGYSPSTAVRSMSTAYTKINGNKPRTSNIIVVMGDYTNSDYFNTTSSTYAKGATVTGYYAGTNYNGTLYMAGDKYVTADTTFQYLTFYGSTSSSGTAQGILYVRGNSLTMGKGLYMERYGVSSASSYALANGNSPDFHIVGGFLNYNGGAINNNNGTILIKSGSYARILAGTRNTGDNGTSHNVTGTASNPFNMTIIVDISPENSTTQANYANNINMLVGGQTDGSIYANSQIYIKNGTVGRILGGSIGYSRDISGYPDNSYAGSTKVNVSGGTIGELYGASLGRQRSDVYFYGRIDIEISGGTITNNVYGAGGGGTTGYGQGSSDPYYSFGDGFTTSTNIKISGGTINGDVYGGGYGYSAYLSNTTIADDGGALYGNSKIEITGGTIDGSIYGAGKGYSGFSEKNALAQLKGNSEIIISGNPTIGGNIYGAGEGIENNVAFEETAKQIGNATVRINVGDYEAIYGGGKVGKLEGTSYVNINNGAGDITSVFGGGKSSNATNTYVYIKGGKTTNVYGGSDTAGTVQSSHIEATLGEVTNIYGGNNAGGVCNNSSVKVNGTKVTGNIYGGGKNANVGTAEVEFLNAPNTIANIFGGGEEADATTTNVYCKGGRITKVFGGSNTNGTVTNANVFIQNGEIDNVYGGNNAGGNTTNAKVESTNGKVNAAIYGGGKGSQTGTTTSRVILTGLSAAVPAVYGGGEEANVGTTNVTIQGITAANVFGGSNTNGTVTTSNVEITSGTVTNVYGGNKTNGQTQNANVTVEGGTVTNVYGGGEIAQTGQTNVTIESNIAGSVFGGGNAAPVNTNTNLTLNSGTISLNVYGGGDEGTVTGNTNVYASGVTILGNLYAGGNGSTAVVYGNTKLNIDNETTVGTTTSVTPISGCVFGSGKAASTGAQRTNTSYTLVNIAGATIYGNVYGGAHTAVINGATNVNIGYDAVENNQLNNQLPTLTKSNIYIKGTIFGGGEANASGDEAFDWDSSSVTEDVNINIDGNGHTSFITTGSIFGAGNAIGVSKHMYITIKNFGNKNTPQNNISIQRATLVTIDNSAITLYGIPDRANEGYISTYFSLCRIEELKLINDSTLYLNYGAFLLNKFSSYALINGQEVKATVNIVETRDPETDELISKTITKNVDNRIYLYEGKVLNIATNTNATSFGEIDGMTFFGIYTNEMNPSTSTGLYHYEFDDGEEITNTGTFSTNSKIRAANENRMVQATHDITVDGFYTNYNNEGYIRTDYIGVSPPNDIYYIWLVGEDVDVTEFVIDEPPLIASKYVTLGTAEVPLSGFGARNTKFVITGFSANLADGISLVDSSQIPDIAPTDQIADSQFGLTMRSGKTGWQTNNKTDFYTANGGSYTGTNTYNSDNSDYTPTLTFCLYHSQNLSRAQNLGNVRIRLQVITPIDGLNFTVSYADILIVMQTSTRSDNFYDSAISPGEEFGLFTTTQTDITDSGMFSMYYPLYIGEFSQNEHYDDYFTYHHAIVSRNSNDMGYAFPQNTKIVMLDMASNKYYYYVVTANDEQTGKYIYNFSDFILMGSTNEHFNEQNSMSLYYNTGQDLIYENFILHVDFKESNIPNDIEDNILLMELKDVDNATIISVFGPSRATSRYSVYKNQDAQIDVTAQTSANTIYVGQSFDLTVTTNFVQNLVNTKTVYDTKFFNQQMGIKISIFDNNNNQLGLDSLFGISFILDNVVYYPRIDGSVRINIAQRVSNVLSRIKVSTLKSATLPTGTYKIKVESFGSSDGIYYGLEASDYVEKQVTIINGSYGLKVTTDNKSKIIDKENGKTLNGNNSLVVNLNYSSNLSNPKITVSLNRRNYNSIYSKDYTKVDIKDYITNDLAASLIENEYIMTTNPVANMTEFLYIKEQALTTGTYKVVFKLYDGDTFIGEAYEYIIIK